MHTVKRWMAAALSLLILTITPAHADLSFLMHTSGWNLDDTAVDVRLTADVKTHMPFDDERLAMLTPITDLLSLRLVTGQNEGLVSIAMEETELLTLQYRGNAVQLSCQPEVTYTALESPMNLLLGADVTAEGGYETLGIPRRSETLLTDGRLLLAKVPAAFADHGKQTKNTNTISGYGKAAYIMDYTFTTQQADRFQALLLDNCPEGWLKEIISGLSFSGKQTIRMYFTAEDVMLRMEYNGTCGPEGDLRTVKLVYKMRHDAEMDRDYIELTSPARKGKNHNTLSFERTVQTDKSGALTMDGDFKYSLSKDGVTSTWDCKFSLKNAFTAEADVISGEISLQTKLNGADKYNGVILAPMLTLSGTQEAPIITGTLEITEQYAGKTTENAIVGIDMKQAGPLTWAERSRTVDLSAMDAEALTATQQEAAASVATALVRPLILRLGKDAQWFFRDLPEEGTQAIIDAAASAAQ